MSRERLVLALDLDDQVAATRLAATLHPYFEVAKVGLELFGAAGPGVVYVLRDMGYRVFIDLKLHDIPNTVERASRVLGSLGPAFVTFHASGGEEMLRAGVAGLVDGAAHAGESLPIALAVTVLTSEGSASEDLLAERLGVAVKAGCQGYVAGASDLPTARALAPALVSVVPGIREAGASQNDQRRTATAREALALGADYLVVGRTVTASPEPAKAAAALLEAISG